MYSCVDSYEKKMHSKRKEIEVKNKRLFSIKTFQRIKNIRINQNLYFWINCHIEEKVMIKSAKF